MPGTTLRASDVVTHLIFTTITCGKPSCCLHVTNKETDSWSFRDSLLLTDLVSGGADVSPGSSHALTMHCWRCEHQESYCGGSCIRQGRAAVARRVVGHPSLERAASRSLRWMFLVAGLCKLPSGKLCTAAALPGAILQPKTLLVH